jgi:hypothetical protein
MTVATLKDPSMGSFNVQSVIAASEYASLLNGNGGDWVAAENQYQTGSAKSSANGAGIFSGYLNKGVQNVARPDAGGVVPASPTPIPGLGSGVNVGGNLLGWTDELAKLLGDLTSPGWWMRVGMGVLGVGLIVGGALIFFSSTKTGQKAVTEGTQAAEVAAVA